MVHTNSPIVRVRTFTFFMARAGLWSLGTWVVESSENMQKYLIQCTEFKSTITQPCIWVFSQVQNIVKCNMFCILQSLYLFLPPPFSLSPVMWPICVPTSIWMWVRQDSSWEMNSTRVHGYHQLHFSEKLSSITRTVGVGNVQWAMDASITILIVEYSWFDKDN